MYTFLHKQFKFNLKKIKKKDKILIAISGGQDSICLIKLIHEYQINNYLNIQAIYIDHQWKKESIIHIKHIINLMKKTRIPISIYQIKNKFFSENKTRQLRYKTLIKHALINNHSIIMTGHNKNDQIETIIQNIIRGSSINGITNFNNIKKINKKISIIRPLIHSTRAEIIWFCRQFCLPLWSDITNYNYKINRNRVRYELIPYLQNYFNPNINKNIENFFKICQEDNEYIKENTIKLYIKSKHKNLIGLNLKLLQKQHPVLQKRVLQLYMYHNFNSTIGIKNIYPIIQQIYHYNHTYYKIYINNLCLHYLNGWIYAYFLVYQP